MKKAASKGTTTRKKKVGTLPARSAKAGNVKGGFLGGIGKALGTPIKTVSPAVLKAVAPPTPT